MLIMLLVYFCLLLLLFFGLKEPRRHYNTIWEGESNLRPNVLRTSILTIWLRSHRPIIVIIINLIVYKIVVVFFHLKLFVVLNS